MIHEAEWSKLVSRGSDYDELLRAGSVATRAADPYAWRAAIRARARADRIRVRTGRRHDDPLVVWALVLVGRKSRDPARHARRVVQLEAFRESSSRATLFGHRLTHLIRAERTRGAGMCDRCDARVYLDWASTPAFMEGEVFEVVCPGAETEESSE